MSFAGLKVVVVGLAREGSAAARFLAEQGAAVTVTDAQPARKLAGRVAALQSLGITFCLGRHPVTLLNPSHTDLLVVSPGVPPGIPFLRQAKGRGLPLTTESRLFCRLCPAPIVGISGSSGKTTTTTLVGNMLRAAGFTTHVGGNIGQPLIGRLAEISPQDRVVMELSSFQLEYFHGSFNRGARFPPRFEWLDRGWSPTVGALLNLTPNHLDRHKTMAAYAHAKRALVQYMGPGQTAVLGLDNPAAAQTPVGAGAAVHGFSARQPVEAGAFLAGERIMWAGGGHTHAICPLESINLRGAHNRLNVLAACAIAGAAGADPPAMAAAIAAFTGVPHRLEPVAVKNGVTYINDSIATSPERLIAALNAFAEPIILLAGGKDKDLPWDSAARLILRRVKILLLFGQAQDLILKAVKAERTASHRLKIISCRTLEQAVAQAQQLAQPGDVVLLSPGGTSYDAYPDFAARGEHFKALVG